ncbi:MAG: hypothetical protein ACOVSW_17870 [Candidatus Kapaibacteriota bacterium]|jgi:hypothetical protein
MNTQSSPSFGRTGQPSPSNHAAVVNNDAMNTHNQRGSTISHPKAHKLRVSGSDRVVRCVARWGSGGFSGGAAKIFHAVFITAQPLASLLEFS